MTSESSTKSKPSLSISEYIELMGHNEPDVATGPADVVNPHVHGALTDEAIVEHDSESPDSYNSFTSWTRAS